MKKIAIIPARYASSRFPGKPLALLGNKPMIMWVYDAVSSSGLFDKVVVATDDERIFKEVVSKQGVAMMTSEHHSCGTQRCQEVLQKLSSLGEKYDVVVNVQGDEPLISKEQLALVLSCFENESAEIATLSKKIDNQEDVTDPNVVKVVSANNRALYFSRSPIPFTRDISLTQALNQGVFSKHIGIYAYRSDVLHKIVKLEKSNLECLESLEQLRWLENGFEIRIKDTCFESIGVDTPEDLKRVNDLIKKENII
ncbi:MAG: 3-deoxy-manno-octulosonate cytidylyltransferase [Bacteroidales bacterium]|jgi:3-deoxy-manno-octulosonate cytidylyltransferase (CMP-KDO synthetase)|nr:3-deoxy-manno-octulosonate cytidylyltransferase [Bacteroidales bacterium]MEE0882880.1 3-deoxy-manno-octulosonate cytidylyltransferase [Bacteroidales bacterium]